MSDYLVRLANQPATRGIIKSIGLPTPQNLRRAAGAYSATPLQGRRALIGQVAGGYATQTVRSVLEAAGASIEESVPGGGMDSGKFDVLAFDSTGMQGVADLRAFYDFFHPSVRSVASFGRVVVLAQAPETADSVQARSAARAVEGFVRSLGKEIGKKGATANLIYVEKGAEKLLEGPLRFFVSDHSTYVDGQAVRVSKPVKAVGKMTYVAPLEGKVALVTGGARGIGAATARRLAAEGAHVVCLDIPGDRETLEATAAEVGGTALPLDITGAETPQKLVDFLESKFGGVDVVIHNAGITRDKTIANMKEQHWDLVLAINLEAILRVDEALLGAGVLHPHGRIVCLSSIGGIAGNMGQTNYGATKAGLIGYVQAQADELADRGICINAVAPGFIETRMTAEMPFIIREAGRRMNSLSQGGQPEDVAELITFLATPGAAGISGNVVRVCGQSLIGA